MKNTKILSTKKLLPNQKQFLLNAGFSVVEADFVSTRPKPFDASRIDGNLIFTSKNAVDSFLANASTKDFINNKVFCVGDKVKAQLEENGFHVEASAPYANELAESIRNYRSEHFTFLCGNLRLETLPMSMRVAGIAFTEIEVYEAQLTPVKINTAVDGILFFSPSGVASYLQQNGLTRQTCFCIGTTTASALKDISSQVIIASRPSVENVIIQCIKYYST